MLCDFGSVGSYNSPPSLYSILGISPILEFLLLGITLALVGTTARSQCSRLSRSGKPTNISTLPKRNKNSAQPVSPLAHSPTPYLRHSSLTRLTFLLLVLLSRHILFPSFSQSMPISILNPSHITLGTQPSEPYPHLSFFRSFTSKCQTA
ncbi:hypothetical protein GGR52DRAFT_29372 [Hypoxylon sp. FL1284]|nr:hypothetical protein GGR52DRAFT_29372 [Hypoxylon sp. FL1284]